jgi:RNA polymerase sigma factor (sigma-70 family)
VNAVTNLTCDPPLEELKNGGNDAVCQLYLRYREPFVKWAGERFHHLQTGDFRDAFQEAVIALYENLRSGKITSLRSSIKTYLFSIGYYKLIARAKESGKITLQNHWNDLLLPSEVHPYEAEKEEELLTNLPQALLQQTGEACRKVLTLFYFHRCSIAEIQLELNYQNEETVRAKKSRCLKNLREKALKMMREHDAS